MGPDGLNRRVQIEHSLLHVSGSDRPFAGKGSADDFMSVRSSPRNLNVLYKEYVIYRSSEELLRSARSATGMPNSGRAQLYVLNDARREMRWWSVVTQIVKGDHRALPQRKSSYGRSP